MTYNYVILFKKFDNSYGFRNIIQIPNVWTMQKPLNRNRSKDANYLTIYVVVNKCINIMCFDAYGSKWVKKVFIWVTSDQK